MISGWEAMEKLRHNPQLRAERKGELYRARGNVLEMFHEVRGQKIWDRAHCVTLYDLEEVNWKVI